MIEGKTYVIKQNGMPIVPVHPSDVNRKNVAEMIAQVSRPQAGDKVTCIDKRSDKHGWFYKVETKDGEGWLSGVALLKYDYEEEDA